VQQELVSVVIPVYNRTGLLEDCVASVQQQIHKSIETIIVNDGSDDGITPGVISRLAREFSNVVAVTAPTNEGPGGARNRGLEAATGRYIQFLDSDDLLRPQKIARQLELLQDHPECGLSYCCTMRPYCSNPDRPWARTGEEISELLPSIIMRRPWGTLSVLWRREVCDQVGKWGPTKVMEDWEYDCRAAILGVRPIHSPEPLAIIRDHKNPRASGMNVGFTPSVTRDYFIAHRNIYKALMASGQDYHMKSVPFARKLFWIARMCGTHGLIEEARESLQMARLVCVESSTRAKIEIFAVVANAMGWQKGVKLCERIRRLRAKRV
jgi:glycosyltransferase involved in cell wall biosynthesis